MGMVIRDDTTLQIILQLNLRLGPGHPIKEMVHLQKEFGMFSPQHSLSESFAVLNIAPVEWSERIRWYRFLDHQLKRYPSDLAGVNGHDRIVEAFMSDLGSKSPLPIQFTTHSKKQDPRVTVGTGRPLVFSNQEYLVVSIPTTPGREARQQAAAAAKARRAKRA